MTDSLILLNSNENFGGEGFFKFENGYRHMTACFQKISRPGQYMWAAAEASLLCGAFPAGKSMVFLPFPLGKKPKKCAIFFIEDGKAYPVLSSGGPNDLLADFCRQNQLEAGLAPLPQAEEIPQKKEETPPVFEAEPANTEAEPANMEAEPANMEAEPANTEAKPANMEAEPAEPAPVVLEEAEEIPGLTPPEREPHTYWDCNETAFLNMLKENPEAEEMNLLIPGSRWVKVEDDGAQYVMGVIFEEDETPLYLCYGFPAPWSETPPDNLEGYSQWIPLDCAHPHDKGYWVIYINAKTGERVR